MNKRILCIFAVLLAIVLVATPAAAGIYTSRIPNIHSAVSNTYGLGVKDMSTKLSYLSAVQSFHFNPITPSGFPGEGTSIPISNGEWNTLFNPITNFGCPTCGCS